MKATIHPTHDHQFIVQPPKQAKGLFIREKIHSPRKGVFGVLSPDKSIYGGPSEVISFIYWPGHATRKQAKSAAEKYLAACLIS